MKYFEYCTSLEEREKEVALVKEAAGGVSLFVSRKRR